MQKRCNKAQAAMEFLMTYGWAILVILIVLSALFYLGIFNPKTTNYCNAQAPFICKDIVFREGEFEIILAAINIVNGSVNSASVNGQNCANIIVNGKQNNQLGSNIVNGLNNVKCYGINIKENDNAKSELIISYKISDLLSHEMKIVGSGQVEKNISVSAGGGGGGGGNFSNITSINTPPIFTQGYPQLNSSDGNNLSRNNLYATWLANDAENVTLNYNIIWYSNNFSNFTSTSLLYNKGTLNIDILNAANLIINQTWKAMIEVSDGEFIIRKNTSELKILDNITTELLISPNLIISNVSSTSITSSSAIITWTTNNPSDSQVEYGTSVFYGNFTNIDTNLVINHSMPLTGLSPNTYYNYRVKSRDANGNLANSSNNIFTTLPLQNISNYDDVLVVINKNSLISEQIGSYFANARNIPSINIARIGTSTNEEIDDAEFSNLRSQLESYILSNNLKDKINYIVTTKGMPLKINRGNTFSTSSPSASVESELTLILGPYNKSIGGNGIVFSPYYYANEKFSRAKYGIYLVTRLDGYIFNDIKAMIDKAASPIIVSSNAKFIFDQDPDWNSNLPGLNNAMVSAHTIVINKGYNSLLDTSIVYIVNQTNVLGYVSWGSNDHYFANYTLYAKPGNIWHPGAIAETYVSTSGRTFTYPASYGQSLIADLIQEGVTGAKGYVYEPFSVSMAIVSVLFDRYTSNYNLAESFYMASRSLSWMDVIIGDPKSSITK